MTVATRPNPVTAGRLHPKPVGGAGDRKPGKLRQGDRTAPKRQQNWDWRAAANFVCGGAGGGLMAATALAATSGADLRPLLVLGMALVAAGLTCVWFEIGRPWRALNVFRHFSTSWMTREASVAPLLFVAGGLALFTGQALLLGLAGLLGLLFVYAQARILAADKGIPAWRHPRSRQLVLLTGLTEGAALLAAAAPVLLPAMLLLPALALLMLLIARAVAWKLYVVALRRDGAPDGSLRAFAELDPRFMRFGHFMPGALAVVAALGLPGAGLALSIGGLAAALAGAWFKTTLVRRAAFTQGLALPHMPVRGRGPAGPAVKPGWGGGA